MSLMVPDNPNQWYCKDPSLLYEEIMAMNKFFPDAKMGFLKQNDSMYWVLDFDKDTFHTENEWKFSYIYYYNHPWWRQKSHSSVIVVPLKPSGIELLEMAKKKGKSLVPRLMNTGLYGKEYSLSLVDVHSPPEAHNVRSAAYYALRTTRWINAFENWLRSDDSSDSFFALDSYINQK